ncbi:IS630 family transposase [Rhizophagus clarus]|uniref:IS630 family transposase n=1 Tax=Rhizophagus clarus TaxID=94130 RepID=A0A8H3LYW4_9GLOM|nr:IS630 family transposase [Rhizophagus clarus]
MTRECSNAVQIQKSLKVNDDIEVSASTVRRALKRNGLAARVKHKKPLLSKKHREKRLNFAKSRQYCWKRPKDPLQDAHVKPTVKFGGGSIFVWGCFTSSGVGYLQDNDPKHTATRTKQWFEDNEIEVLSWPPQSPDLNPIEHLWNDIDRHLRALDIEIRGKDMLLEQISNVWNETALEACSKLIETMPERINDVIKAKGGYTRW